LWPRYSSSPWWLADFRAYGPRGLPWQSPSFTGYAAWTFASLLWASNQGDAWIGAGQTLLYPLTFWLAAGLIASWTSQRWVLLASVLGPDG
jgi:hypothetical protein